MDGMTACLLKFNSNNHCVRDRNTVFRFSFDIEYFIQRNAIIKSFAHLFGLKGNIKTNILLARK